MLSKVKNLFTPKSSVSNFDSERLLDEHLLEKACITDVERAVKKCKDSVLNGAKYLPTEEFYKMKDDLRVNCLKRGNFEDTKGVRYLVAVDGSEASWRAFHTAVKKVTPDDHLFIAMVWRSHRFHDRPEREQVILNHVVWTAGCRILTEFENKVKGKIEYTLVLIAGWEPRTAIVAMCKKWNIHGVFVGVHRKDEKKHKRAGRTSTHTYLNSHLKHIQLFLV